MNKEISFTEKNSFVQREARPEMFNKDFDTFKKVFKGHALISEIEKANQFTKQALHERLILTLFQAKTPAEILEARGTKVKQPVKTTPVKSGIKALNWKGVKDLAKELNISIKGKKRQQLEQEIEDAQKKSKE